MHTYFFLKNLIPQMRIKTSLSVFFVCFIYLQCTKKQSFLDTSLTDNSKNNIMSSSNLRGIQNGSGSMEDPYLIYDEHDFYQIISGTEDQINYYQLMNDIRLTESQQKLPQKNTSYIHLEGNGLVISKVHFKTSVHNAGIFSQLNDSEIKNLKIDDVNIDGQIYAGVLIGSAYRVVLDNIQISNTRVKGSAGVGGIVAVSSGIKITNSNTAGDLIVTKRTAGGIIGAAYSGLTHIENCSTTMSIDASLAAEFWLTPVAVGGIIGRVQTDDAGLNVIKNNFANNVKIIGQPNAILTTQNGYPGFKRILGAILPPNESSQMPQVLLENNFANDGIEMFTANQNSVSISDLNSSELGHTQLHGGTIIP